MEPIVSTSFIPKRPVSSEPIVSSSSSHRSSVGLLSIFTFVVVIGTGLAFVGVYLYQQSLISQKASLEQSITTAQNGLGTTFVSDMQRLSLRIDGVKSLIQSHVVVSPIFAALQATTLQSLQYKTFTYDFKTDPSTNAKVIEVQLTGTAKDYATLALQSDAFAQSTLIKNPVFSALTVEDKTQLVDFKLAFNVDPNSLSYQSFIKNSTPAPAPAAAQ